MRSLLPHVIYKIINWSCANTTIAETIQTTSNKVLRIISFENFTASAKPLFNFQPTRNLDFKEAFDLECAKLIFAVSNGSQCAILDNFFGATAFRHCYQTRQSTKNQLAFPIMRTNYKDGSLHAMA